MSTTPTRNNRGPGQIDLPTSNPFADSALLTSTENTPQGNTPRSGPNSPATHAGHRPSRVTYRNFSSSARRRASSNTGRKFMRDEELAQLIDGDEDSGPPPVPTVMKDASSTPLPILPMLVLAIAMLGEFLSANVSTPFLLFMVESFDVAEDEAQVGYLTGILASMFFITQFLTSLLWSTVANKHGTRAVLFVSLLGNAITCVIFGTSRSFAEAVCIRLAQGVFNGAVGVARGSVATITAPDNEGRAYAILGFCWGMGGVAGAIVGGSFESPATKFGGSFDTPFWRAYPYLLPTAIASAVTLTGAFLSLFLAWDGGPRSGAIRLPEKEPESQGLETIPQEADEDEETPGVTPTGAGPTASYLEPEPEPTGFAGLQRRVSKRLSGYFARRVREHQALAPSPGSGRSPGQSTHQGRTASGPVVRARAGSAYGYGSKFSAPVNGYRTRHGSIQTLRRRRSSAAGPGGEEGEEQVGEMTLAQRLLMANEFTVTSMGDLWVAAALNTDVEVFEETPAASDEEGEEFQTEQTAEEIDISPTKRRTSSTTLRRPESSSMTGMRRFASLQPGESPNTSRRFSTSSNMPAIYTNTGLVEPPANMPYAGQDPFIEPNLASITEGRVAPALMERTLSTEEAKPGGLWSSLPLVIIFQYGMLALHNTTHDQVFYSYLVSQYRSGGLGLNPAQFAQLIALMSVGQMFFQFYLYPNVGPPRGRFSHLSMFRVGSLLFIPAYLSVIPYRFMTNANGDGNIFVMIGLAISTAVRYCGSTFTYTAVAVLLNYMSPPPVVGMANGLAQSIVSLARFIGPVLGGYIWSVSVQAHPSGYAFGFFIVSGICGLAILHSLTIR